MAKKSTLGPWFIYTTADQLYKLFLFTKAVKHFPLMVSNGYNTFPFCTKYFFIVFNYIRSIFGFIYFIDFFVQLFCFNCVIVDKRIYDQLFQLFFVESLRLFNIFKTFSPLKTKQYSINLKQPLQTKTRLCWAQNSSLSTWLRVLYHKHFCKTVFQINLIIKKKS